MGLRKGSSKTVLIVVVIVGAAVFTGVAYTGFSFRRQVKNRRICSNNLKQVGLAVQLYHDSYDKFPTAVITDENGRPIRSWRVALLPYIEQRPLWDKYKAGGEQPWDSPNVQALAEPMPNTYRCPGDRESGPTDTSYAMITQEGTRPDGQRTFGGPRNSWMGYGHIKDGSSNTIMLVEAVGSEIHWMEPRDVTYEEVEGLGFTINHSSGKGIRGPHSGGVNVILADGSARFLPDSVDPEVIKQLILINDEGEPELPWPEPEPQGFLVGTIHSWAVGRNVADNAPGIPCDGLKQKAHRSAGDPTGLGQSSQRGSSVNWEVAVVAPHGMSGDVVLKLDRQEPRAVSVVDCAVRFRLPNKPPNSGEPGRSPVKVPSLWHAEVLVP